MLRKSMSALISLVFIGPFAFAAYPTDERTTLDQKIADFDALSPKPTHPRFLMGPLGAGIKSSAQSGERVAHITEIKAKLGRQRTKAPTTTELEEFGPQAEPRLWRAKFQLYVEEAVEAAFAYYITGDSVMLDEVTKRIRDMSPIITANGCAQDIYYSREFMISFAMAYDFAYYGLLEDDKKRVADILTTCANKEMPTLATDVRNTYESGLDFNGLAKYTAALLLIRGDAHFVLLESKNYLPEAVKSYVGKLPNFGGIDGGYDGGYANGSSYFVWDTSESVISWDVISRVLNYPLYEKPYVKNVPNFLLWTLPPLSPAGAFGDGAEVNRYSVEAAREGQRMNKSILHRYLTDASVGAQSRWFIDNLPGGDLARMSHVLSPATTGTGVTPVARSKLFSTVGIAAMHSSLADTQRTSVFFKSSPKGSVNHGHSDQNSFVIYNKGRVMAMDSGAYVAYDDAHWQNWYKKTLAHNAITYNGGTGQEATGGTYGSLTSTGTVTEFNRGGTGPMRNSRGIEYDYVIGDATKAYGQNLAKAVRTLVYVRPSTVIVIDQLKSAYARNWEYNFHTPVTGNLISGSSAGSASGNQYKFDVASDATMCMKVHSPASLTRTESSGYGGYAPVVTTVPAHFLNRFSYPTGALAGTFVSIIRLDCTAPTTSDVVSFTNGTINVKLGTWFEANMTDAGVFTAP